MAAQGDRSHTQAASGKNTDVALAADHALESLLEWRRTHLQRGLQDRIKAVRHPATPAAAAGQAGDEQASDREHVHQLRTGLRRLRSMAEAFPQHWRGPKPKHLRQLASAAGSVRDLDVLLEALEEQRHGLDGTERKRLRRLVCRLQKRRDRARFKLAQRIRQPPHQRLSAPSQLAAVEAPGGEAEGGEAEGAARHRAALPLLRASLIRQLAALRLHPGWGHGDRPQPSSHQECQQHELRKAFKRLRYQLELLEALKPDLRDRLLILKQTQTSLGLLQDLVIWRDLLKRQLKGRLDRQLPELSAHWRHQADAAWADWCLLRQQWLDPADGLEAWQRWLLELELPGGHGNPAELNRTDRAPSPPPVH